MAVATGTQTATKVVTKVSRKLVAKLNELTEVRSLANLYNKELAKARSEVFAEIGEKAQVLIHNGVEVAVIAEVVKPAFNLDLLKEKFPEAYEACSGERSEFHIRKATRSQ